MDGVCEVPQPPPLSPLPLAYFKKMTHIEPLRPILRDKSGHMRSI